MKYLFGVLASLLVVLAPIAASAQAAQVPAGWSTQTSKVGDLLANPITRAVLERHFPGVSGDWRMKMVKGKTFRQLHTMAPSRLPSAALDAVDRDLQALPAR
jgi:para-nitrobenzyl esterase